MTLHNALCFPETRPEQFSRRFFPLFFDSLLYFTPTKPQGPDDAILFFRNPFAEDRDSARFEQLAGEFKGRGGEFYRHYLSSLAATDATASDPSIAELISLLAGQKTEERREPNQLREKRWQARLTLLLAALLSEEQEEITRSLDLVAAQKRRMLAALQGGEDGAASAIDGDFGADRPSYPQYSSLQLKNLLRAIAAFFLADAEAQSAMPCTAHAGAADLLLELYEKHSRSPAIELAGLILPAGIDVGEQAPYFAFRQKTENIRQNLLALLTECSAATVVGDALREQVRRTANSFNAMGEGIAKNGAARLTFYLFPAMPLASLFSTAFDVVPQASGPTGGNGLLALLTPT